MTETIITCEECGKTNRTCYRPEFEMTLCESCNKSFINHPFCYIPPSGELHYNDVGEVICHLCGRAYHKLTTHLTSRHNMSSETYKRMFGLNKNTKLTSKSYQEEHLKKGLSNLRGNKKTQFKKGHSINNGKMRSNSVPLGWDNNEKLLGHFLREVRAYRGLTSVKLSEKCGITPSNICSMERNERIPQSNNLKRLCDSLDIHFGKMMTIRQRTLDIIEGKVDSEDYNYDVPVYKVIDEVLLSGKRCFKCMYCSGELKVKEFNKDIMIMQCECGIEVLVPSKVYENMEIDTGEQPSNSEVKTDEDNVRVNDDEIKGQINMIDFISDKTKEEQIEEHVQNHEEEDDFDFGEEEDEIIEDDVEESTDFAYLLKNNQEHIKTYANIEDMLDDLIKNKQNYKDVLLAIVESNAAYRIEDAYKVFKEELKEWKDLLENTNWERV